MSNQYFATNRKVGDGSTTVWSFSFEGARPDNQNGTAPYLQTGDVKVALVTYTATGLEERTLVNSEVTSPSQVTVSPAIPAGVEFVIFRTTLNTIPVADFTDFASISERDLDDSYRQTLFVVQEALDNVQDAQLATSEVVVRSQEALDNSQTALSAAAAAEASAAASEISAANAVVVADEAATDAANAVTVANAADAKADQAITDTATFDVRVDDLQESVDALLGEGAAADLMFTTDNLAGLADVVASRANIGVLSVAEVEAAAQSAATEAVADHVSLADPHDQYLSKASNLSDLTDPVAARGSLNLNAAALAGTTDSRTSSSVDDVLQAKGMNDHRTSGDHDVRYARLTGGADANFTAMPQVGGDPIVESGSNSDGSWTRWADGTQQCWTERFSVDSRQSAARLGSFWSFPSSFTEDPAVMTVLLDFGSLQTMESTDRADARVTALSPTAAFLNVYRISGASAFESGDSHDVAATAVGRWK